MRTVRAVALTLATLGVLAAGSATASAAEPASCIQTAGEKCMTHNSDE